MSGDADLARRMYPSMRGDVSTKAPLRPRSGRPGVTPRRETRDERIARLLFPSMRAMKSQ